MRTAFLATGVRTNVPSANLISVRDEIVFISSEQLLKDIQAIITPGRRDRWCIRFFIDI